MLRFILIVAALPGICMGQAVAPPRASAPSQRTERLIEEIESLASAEPPLLGIDTQIEAAKILLPVRRKQGRRFLDDALNRIRSLRDPRTVRELLYPAVQLLLQDNPEDARLLVSAQLSMVQGRKPERESGLLLASFATLLDQRFPELAASCKAEFERINKADPDKDRLEGKRGVKPPDVDALNLDERIALARKQKESIVRIQMFMDVIDDEETPPRKKASLAAEVLPETDKLPLGEDRLISQSMLTRRLFEAGDRPGAALAAQMLEQTFVKMYDCEASACIAVTQEGSPGEAVSLFAQYLDENGISPADLGLTHRSLQVRMMLIELKKTLEAKR